MGRTGGVLREVEGGRRALEACWEGGRPLMYSWVGSPSCMYIGRWGVSGFCVRYSVVVLDRCYGLTVCKLIA